ncbi:PDDEXK family nuclease [Paraburkholderia strydomiana]|uniref:TnsA endonuclease N-terminal domain-containing protein n=1 Tax=Paraburkholderia strydomiana TaxID=1245417 RepID=A0ABW9BWT5_9BURK
MRQHKENSYPVQSFYGRKAVPPKVRTRALRDAVAPSCSLKGSKQHAGIEHAPEMLGRSFVPVEIRREWGDVDLRSRPDKVTSKPAHFHLRDLPLPFETPPNVMLPPVDDYGWPTGEDYEPMLEARTPMSLGTRATMRGVKYRRRFEMLSMGELAVQVAHMFNPYVIDLREQYPVYDPADFWRANASGERMLRRQVMTIDLVLTYTLPSSNTLRYHAISVKHAGYDPSPKDRTREEKERTAMAARGWTWELIRANEIPRIEVENYMLLHSFIRHTDAPLSYESARIFARCLKQSSAKGKMSSVVKRISKRLCIEPDEGFRLFAVAAAYGFIMLDHGRRLKLHEPIALVR